MGKKASATRTLVLEILMELEKPDRKANLVLRGVLMKYDYLPQRDKAFIRRLAEGCSKERLRLDYLIDAYAVTKKGKLKPVVRNILRMGIYQILDMDSVPDSAACNESVQLAVDKGLGGLKGFVNGVLRRVAREKEHLPWPSERKEQMSVQYSMPLWLVNRFLEQYGEEEATALLSAMQKPSVTYLHLREDLPEEAREQLCEEIEGAGYELTQHPYLPYAYALGKNEGMERIPGFLEGNCTVQDVSSMLAVELCQIEKGSLVLDLCAAPGGKSVHSAIKVGKEGRVISRDLTPEKVAYLEENRQRMQLLQMHVEQADATIWDEKLEGAADYVIADLPCSGLGIMGRKGDIRYHIVDSQIRELQQLQRQILVNAAKYLKKGGKLLFSTCTLTQEENLENYHWIKKELGLTPVDIASTLPKALGRDAAVRESAAEGYIQLLPGVHACDGFFISIFTN